MKNLFKKIWKNIRISVYSLFYGMKVTEDNILHQDSGGLGGGTNINKHVEDRKLSKALLKGEVTQEVEELRYRTYLIDNESKSFTYYAPTLALREKQQKKNYKYDDSDGLELITSQPNDEIVKKLTEDIVNFGTEPLKCEHRIKVEYDGFIPRFRLDNYITRLDVKRLDENHAILDAFVPIYAKPDDFKTQGFLNEIKKIKNEGVRSDMVNIEKISFTTYRAYKLANLIKFVFKNIHLREIKEFDGHYILRFKSSIEQDTVDLTKTFYSKSMDEKYKAKEKKDVSVNMADYMTTQLYKCEECGKEVLYDMELMAELEPYQGRDITDIESENPNPIVLDFMDMQISEQTLNKRLCSSCLKKYVLENKIPVGNKWTN